MSMASEERERSVRVSAGPVTLGGNLGVPEGARSVVLFAHGSGSGRHSPRNRYVAEELQRAGLATLLIDLLTPEEEEEEDLRTGDLRFDIGLLAERLVGATDWLEQNPDTRQLRVGHFGASTGAREGVKVDWEKLFPPRGFQALPRRWVVERTFSWLGQNRRMSKDYERLPESSKAFIYVAISRLMVRRLARR